MEVVWNDTPRARWERLTAEAAWQQHWGYGGACARLGSKLLRAEVREGSETVALAQFTHRAFFGRLHVAACTRGPVWTCEAEPGLRVEVYRKLRKTMPLRWPNGVFFTPDAAADGALAGAGLRRVMSPYSTAALDLGAEDAALLGRMDGKWRNRLRAAERSGVRVRRLSERPEAWEWLLAAEQAQRRAKRYAALPVQIVPAWQMASGKAGSVRTYVAELAGEIVAAMLFLVHGKGALYHIGWSSDAGRRANAKNLLLWKAARKLRGMGVSTLDLGGLSTDDGPGIARFKLGTGAGVRRLCGTWY